MLAIYAPYDRSEVTLSAVRLAGLAIGRGWPVRYVANQVRDRDIHPYWDERVEVSKSSEATVWAAACKMHVWFVPDRKRFMTTLQASPRSLNVLALSWHDISAELLTWIHWYDRVICSANEVQQDVRQRMDIAHSCAFRTVPWSSGVATVEPKIRDAGQLSVYTPVSAYTVKTLLRELLNIIDLVMTSCPDLKLTLAVPCTLSNGNRRTCERLHQHTNKRFVVRSKLSLDAHLAVMHQHDWVWLPSPRSSNGLWADQATSCGKPVLCWDVPPLNSLVVNGINGRLVPCAKGVSTVGEVTAKWDNMRMIQHAVDAFSDAGLFEQMTRRRPWPADERRRFFNGFWDEIMTTAEAT